MYVDCNTCPEAGRRCDSCVVGFFMDRSTVAPLDHREAQAVDVLLSLGMIGADEAREAYAVREALPLVS